MGLLSDIFQQNQQIAQNPASVVRTPQQQAYDNLLNRQYDIEQQNKKYNTFNGLIQGAGGLGKILASAFVKSPMQQYGAMQSLGEQETRTDNLRQAYNLARNAQNKDYVQQAKEQLDLANADDERNYNRELTKNQIAYKKAMDLLEQQNKDRQFELANKQFDNQIQQQDQAQKNADRNYELEKAKLDFSQKQAEAEALAKQQAEEKKQIELEEKKREEKIKSAQSLLDSYNSAGAIEPKDYLALRKLAATNPDKVYDLLEDSGNYKEAGLILGFLPWKTAGNKNKFKLGINLDNKNTKGL